MGLRLEGLVVCFVTKCKSAVIQRRFRWMCFERADIRGNPCLGGGI